MVSISALNPALIKRCVAALCSTPCFISFRMASVALPCTRSMFCSNFFRLSSSSANFFCSEVVSFSSSFGGNLSFVRFFRVRDIFSVCADKTTTRHCSPSGGFSLQPKHIFQATTEQLRLYVTHAVASFLREKQKETT